MFVCLNGGGGRRLAVAALVGRGGIDPEKIGEALGAEWECRPVYDGCRRDVTRVTMLRSIDEDCDGDCPDRGIDQIDESSHFSFQNCIRNFFNETTLTLVNG